MLSRVGAIFASSTDKKDAGKKKSISLSCAFGRHTLGDFELNSKNTPYPLFYRLKQNEYGGETVRRSCLLRAAIVDSGQSVTLLSWGSLFNFKNVTSLYASRYQSTSRVSVIKSGTY